MRKESFQGILLGIVIMCAVFAFITVAWAAFSSTLTINGSATVQAVTWKVKFSVDGTAEPGTGGASLTGEVAAGTNAVLPLSGPLTISENGLNVSGAVGTFTSNGDKITYDWYLVNYGDFNANVSTLNLTSGTSNVALTCTSNSGATNETEWCTNNLSAKLYVEDYSTATPTNLATPTEGTYSVSVPSAVGASSNSNKKHIFLVVEYTGNAAASSDIAVTISPALSFNAQQNGARVTVAP